MKKLVFLSALFYLIANTSEAQFQRIEKKPTKQAQVIKPVALPTSTRTVRGTILQPVASTSNPVKIVNLGNNRNMRVEMVKDVSNWSSNENYASNEISRSPSTNGVWNCANKTVKFTAESTSFMPAMQNQNSSLLPGTIYTFESFYSGTPSEFTQSRNPMTLYTSNLRTTGPIAQQVNDPKGSTISTAIGSIISPFSSEKGSAGLIYRTFSSDNESEFKMKVTAGGSYGAFSADASYNLNTYEKHFYLTIDVIKPMFNITAERPQQGFFSDPSVEASNANLIYIKEVRFGTRVLVNLDIIVSSRDDIAKISASYGSKDTVKTGNNFHASFDLLKTLKTSKTTVNAYLVGAPQNVTTLDKDKLEEQIKALVATCNYTTAEPISYVLGDMSGRTIGIKSITDEFVVPDCTPASSVYQLQSARVEITSGDDGKERPSTFGVGLFKLAPQPSGSDQMLFDSPSQDNMEEIAQGYSTSINLRKNVYPANTDVFSLDQMKRGGRLEIWYHPNFPLDAWKINNVKITLNFVDQHNTPLQKTIRYDNLTATLTKNMPLLECRFDEGFTGDSPSVKTGR